MPPRPKTPEEREKERSIIIQAALETFGRTGYESLTMRQIAAACGFSPTKIYYYFSNKEELYFCLMKEGFNSLLQQVKAAYCQGGSSEERLKLVNTALFDFGMQHPRYYRIMLTDDVPRRTDYMTDSALWKAADEATNCGLDFYKFWCKCVQENGHTYGFDVSYVECSLLFSMIHGTINLMISRVLPEVEMDYHQLCAFTVNEIQRWFATHELPSGTKDS